MAMPGEGLPPMSSFQWSYEDIVMPENEAAFDEPILPSIPSFSWWHEPAVGVLPIHSFPTADFPQTCRKVLMLPQYKSRQAELMQYKCRQAGCHQVSCKRSKRGMRSGNRVFAFGTKPKALSQEV